MNFFFTCSAACVSVERVEPELDERRRRRRRRPGRCPRCPRTACAVRVSARNAESAAMGRGVVRSWGARRRKEVPGSATAQASAGAAARSHARAPALAAPAACPPRALAFERVGRKARRRWRARVERRQVDLGHAERSTGARRPAAGCALRSSGQSARLRARRRRRRAVRAMLPHERRRVLPRGPISRNACWPSRQRSRTAGEKRTVSRRCRAQ